MNLAIKFRKSLLYKEKNGEVKRVQTRFYFFLAAFFAGFLADFLAAFFATVLPSGLYYYPQFVFKIY